MQFLTALLLTFALSAPAFAQFPKAAPGSLLANSESARVRLVTVNSVDGDNVVAGRFKFSAKRFDLKGLYRTQLLVVTVNPRTGRIRSVVAQRPSPNGQTR